jgi:hypothetical protein
MKKPLPTVTQIIRESNVGPDWSMVRPEIMEAKATLGTSVHRLCSDFARGKVKLADSPASDYARQFIKWLADSGAKVLRSEFEVKSKVSGLGYVGHPDLDLDWKNARWMVDIKTGQFHPSHELQLAGYCDGLIWVPNRAVLKLTPTSAKLIPMKNTKEADQAWAACCTLYRWRQQP